MAISETHRKQLAEKYLGKKQLPHIESHLNSEANFYLRNFQHGVRKELDKLDDELEKLYQYSDKPEYRESIERTYIHTRAVLMGVFHSLEKEIKAWKVFHHPHSK